MAMEHLQIFIKFIKEYGQAGISPPRIQPQDFNESSNSCQNYGLPTESDIALFGFFFNISSVVGFYKKPCVWQASL